MGQVDKFCVVRRVMAYGEVALLELYLHTHIWKDVIIMQASSQQHSCDMCTGAAAQSRVIQKTLCF